MKIKRLLSVIGLGLFAAASAGVGALVLKKSEVNEVRASDDTMFSVVIDLADAVGYTDFHKPEVHYYGTGIDAYADLHLLTGTNYTVNITFDSTSQTIDHIQFLFKQTNNEDKWSNSLDFSPSHEYAYNFAFKNTWTGNNWDVEAKTSGLVRFQYYGSGENNLTKYFKADIASKTYKVNFTIVSEGFVETDLGQVFFSAWNLGALRDDSLKYVDNYSLNSFRINAPGEYDIFLYNDYSDNGVFSVKMHSETTTSIYLVGTDITEDTSVYTFGEGGTEQFGAFPGKKLKDIASAQEIHGDLKFQGYDNYIWRLTLNMYYPAADHIILSQINEHGVVGTQTADMLLISKSAYWFSYDADYHNDLAGSALQFLFAAEEVRKAASDQSVCDVSKADAESIVYSYMSLGEFMQETYIDCTTVNTWKDSTRSAKEYVSYKAVIEELAKIAEINLSSPSRYTPTNVNRNANITTIIIVLAVSLSLVGFTTLIVVRRRKHQ